MTTLERDAPICPRCHGSGACRDCGGSGHQPCLACEGKGQRATTRGHAFPCKTCGGSGQVSCPPACASCGGAGTISEALQEAVREKYTPRFVETVAGSSVTTVLLIVNVAVFMITRESGDQGARLLSLMTNHPFVTMTGEYWRFVTPMFLHGGFLHLALNCVFMLQWCPQIEQLYGGRVFLALYLFSGVCGDVLSWYGHRGWAGVGASGALFGVATAYLGLHVRYGLFDRSQMRGWAVYLVAFLVLGFLGDPSLGGARLDNWGHLGGALGGLLFALVAPRPRGNG